MKLVDPFFAKVTKLCYVEVEPPTQPSSYKGNFCRYKNHFFQFEHMFIQRVRTPGINQGKIIPSIQQVINYNCFWDIIFWGLGKDLQLTIKKRNNTFIRNIVVEIFLFSKLLIKQLFWYLAVNNFILFYSPDYRSTNKITFNTRVWHMHRLWRFLVICMLWLLGRRV